MTKLAAHVEEKMTGILLDMIALAFDGWSCESRYLVAVPASFESDNDRGPKQAMLRFSSLANETGHTTQEHKLFIKHVLCTYGRSWASVIALIGYNVSVNKRLASIIAKLLIGCASRRFNLAIKDMINANRYVFEVVQKPMG